MTECSLKSFGFLWTRYCLMVIKILYLNFWTIEKDIVVIFSFEIEHPHTHFLSLSSAVAFDVKLL